MFDPPFHQEMITEFVNENREALNQVEEWLLRMESDPSRREGLKAVYRHMHTVKGNCRMLGFSQLEELAHKAESLLDLLRDRKLNLTPPITAVLLQVVDRIRERLGYIAQHGDEGQNDFVPIIATLTAMAGGASTDEAGPDIDDTPDPPEMPDLEGIGQQLAAGGSGDGNFVRIAIDRLDRLMNQVGELVTGFHHYRYLAGRDPASTSLAASTLQSQLADLQDEILQYRLQPIARIWEGYHRLVRDLAVTTGKKVLLEEEGGETEVDRSVLLAIKDPLGHLIRNAVDHGLEPPDERARRGKHPVGRIRLFAEQRHGRIYMEVSDDGRGIDPGQVRDKALAMGLITPAQAESRSNGDLLRLILAPGFTTTRQVTRLSGRGTGLDVVQDAVVKVGGAITIHSVPGQGATFRLRIPQTMSIVPSLLVTAREEVYAVPQSHIIELVSYYPPELGRQVEYVLDRRMVRLRDQLMPLNMLEEQLWLGSSVPEVRSRPALHMVVVQTEEGRFGLGVDAIGDPIGLVIKPLGKMLVDLHLFAGSAILPDGKVCFLLDLTACTGGDRRTLQNGP